MSLLPSERFQRIASAIELVEVEHRRLALGIEDDLPPHLRRRLLVLGSSVHDYVIWIRRDLDEATEEMSWWRALEIESGVEAHGVTAREAVDRYFQADVLDLPRAHDEPKGER